MTSRPPELQLLDLREVIRPIELTVVDSLGQAIPGAEIVPTWDPEGRFVVTATDKEGRARFGMDAEPADLVVRARGYRPQLVAGCRADRRITLRPGIPLQVALRDLPLLPEGLDIKLRLEPIDPEVEDHRIRAVIKAETSWTPRSPVFFVLPCAGTWRVHWEASGHVPRSIGGTTRKKEWLSAKASPETPESLVKIEDGDTPSQVTLDIPPEIRSILEGSK